MAIERSLEREIEVLRRSRRLDEGPGEEDPEDPLVFIPAQGKEED